MSNVYIDNIMHIDWFDFHHIIINSWFYVNNLVLKVNIIIDITPLVLFVYVSSIGRVLNQEQYLMKDWGLKEDILMLLLLSLVTLPHLH